VSIASKLKIDNGGMLVTSVFYAAIGVVFFVLLPMTGFSPYLAVIAIFSLLTAYGVFMRRTWAIWFVVILFFVGTTFSIVMIYYLPQIDPVLGASSIVYLILTWVFTIYSWMKRKTFDT